MRKALRFVIRAVLFTVVAGGVFVALAPREAIERGPVAMPDLADPDAWLAAREAQVDGITPGAEAQIIWAGEVGTPSPVVLLYLHGFSATPAEARPVPDLVAEALGANLILGRLPGHGRDGAALASARASDWVDETAAMLELARGIGEQVVILGVSTGGTLASFAMTQDDMARDVSALVLISPNYRVANPAGRLLEWPLARVWVPWIAGAERQFEPMNPAHGRFWTTQYPTVATVSMGTLLRETRAADYSGMTTPAFFLFSDLDQVISATAVRDFAEGWGGPVSLQPITDTGEGIDPNAHVLAGDILSPALTERISSDVADWVRETLGL